MERLFRRLKGFRRIFSRFEKLDVRYMAYIHFALVIEALRLCEHALAALSRPDFQQFGVVSVQDKGQIAENQGVIRQPGRVNTNEGPR